MKREQKHVEKTQKKNHQLANLVLRYMMSMNVP